MSRMAVHLHVGCQKSQFFHVKSEMMCSFLVDQVEGRRYSNYKGLRTSRAHYQRAVGVARNKLKICNSMTSGQLLLQATSHA